jgi:predicted RND superfamily exporter protein
MIANLVSRRPLYVLAFAIVVTIVLAAGIPQLTMRPFFEGDLPANDPVLKANERYTKIFGKDEIAYLALVRDDTIYHRDTLAKIPAITDELNALDHVLAEETLSLATIRKVKWRDWGLDVRKYLSPLPSSPEQVARLREDVRHDRDIYDRLVSKDEKATLFVVRLEPGYDQRQLYLSLHAIADKYAGPERIYPFGHQVMNEEANMGILHDARVLGPVALLLMAMGISVFFRSLGFMHYIGYPMSVLSSSIPAMLIAIGSSYMIHVIYSYLEHASGASTAERMAEGIRKIATPILLAAGTSMVGFATLVVFKILTIREFGISVAIGVAFAAFLALAVLPSIVILQGRKKPPRTKESFIFLNHFLRWLGRVGVRHRRWVVVLGAVVLAVSVAGILRVKVGYAPEEIFPKHHPAREVVSLFVNEFNGPYTINAMFTAPEPDGLKSPEVLRQIDAFQQYAESIPLVKSSASFVDIIKKMNRILNEDDPAYDKVPESREMVAQLLLLHSLTQDPVQFETMVDYDIQRCKVAITTTAIDSMQLERIFDQLSAYSKQHFSGDLKVAFGGRSLIWMAMNDYIIHGKIINIIVNTILIWIICALAFRSVRLGFIGIVPLSLATLTTFGLMGHLGIRLDTATAVLTGISVGVGVDFAIHFISRLKRESLQSETLDDAIDVTVVHSGRAIVFDGMSNILGFVTFIFSGFGPVRDLGVLMCFTMIMCVLLTLLLIPTLVALVPVPYRYAKEPTIFLRPREKEEAAAASAGASS